MSGKPLKKRGPEPEILKIKGDWQKAVAKVLKKPMPPKTKEKPKG
jgi:hypothetical protein